MLPHSPKQINIPIAIYNISGRIMIFYDNLTNIKKSNASITLFGETYSIPDFPYKNGELLYLEPFRIDLK
jgi:hypothetical protein